ncbi:MAG: hypothetical protein AABW75_03310 [Nanoarchaeota archaeon]
MTLTKNQLQNYLKDKFDVRLDQIFEELNLAARDLPFLEVYLEELVNEKWIKKVMCGDGVYEYGPGKKLNFGGIQG